MTDLGVLDRRSKLELLVGAASRKRFGVLSPDNVKARKERDAWVEKCRTDLYSWSVEALCHMPLPPRIRTAVPARHHRLIISELEDVLEGRTPRLIIEAPPGSAKSTYTSLILPSAAFQRRRNMRIIGASHTADLAVDFSGKLQDLITESGDVLSYGLRTWNKKRWYTTNGGAYLAAGVGMAIPGFRADLGIIDDPIKSRQAADSETDRKMVWEWFNGSFERRLTPGAPVIIILCMTGDTPVMMADGTERALRGIRAGDRVATYKDGAIKASTVHNWANQGPDNVFAIKMKSGITVRANARHPFLVYEDGEERWQRTDSLRRGSVILRVTRESGRGSSVPSMAAMNWQSAGECVSHTMEKRDGLKDIGHHLSILYRTARRICATVMELTFRTMSSCFPIRMAFVPSASSPQFQDTRSTSALITTMTRDGCADYSVITATSWSGRDKQKKSCCEPLDTFAITHDTVAEVLYCGVEEVFDIEVEDTANFIANGLISHNTRWHEDDLVGRLLETQSDQWKLLRLTAEAEEPIALDDGSLVDDPLGREPGEWLWEDDDYGYGAELALIKDNLIASGEVREWSSQYQQSPRPREGSIFKIGNIQVISAAVAGGKTVRAYDLAATKDTGTRQQAYTAGVKMTMTPNRRIVIEDVSRTRGGPDDVERLILNTAGQDGKSVEVGIPQDPGQAGKTQILAYTKLLHGFRIRTSPETGDKAERARPIASQVNNGNVDVVAGPWVRAFLNELAAFPSGATKDQVDALSRGYSMLLEKGSPLILSNETLQYIASQPARDRFAASVGGPRATMVTRSRFARAR